MKIVNLDMVVGRVQKGNIAVEKQQAWYQPVTNHMQVNAGRAGH